MVKFYLIRLRTGIVELERKSTPLRGLAFQKRGSCRPGGSSPARSTRTSRKDDESAGNKHSNIKLTESE